MGMERLPGEHHHVSHHLYYGCLFGLMRHSGPTTAVATDHSPRGWGGGGSVGRDWGLDSPRRWG